LFIRRTEGTVTLGSRVTPALLNPVNTCHGGWITSLFDMILPVGGAISAGMARHFMTTVSLSVDFLAPVAAGSWIEGQSELLRKSRKFLFVQGLLRVEGEIVARGSGVFKVGPEIVHEPIS